MAELTRGALGLALLPFLLLALLIAGLLEQLLGPDENVPAWLQNPDSTPSLSRARVPKVPEKTSCDRTKAGQQESATTGA